MNTTRIANELLKIKNIVDKQETTQCYSAHSGFNNFYEVLNSLGNYISKENKSKLNLAFIGGGKQENIRKIVSRLEQSEKFKSRINCTALTVYEALSYDHDSPIYRLLLQSDRSGCEVICQVGGTCFYLHKQSTFRLGRRSTHANIVVPDHYEGVSDKHAVIFSVPEEWNAQEEWNNQTDLSKIWLVRDLSSSSGTFLNQAQIKEPLTIRPGNIVTLGGKEPSDKVPGFLVIEEPKEGSESINPVLGADIYVLFLESEGELNAQEKRLISYLEQLRMANCLLLISEARESDNQIEKDSLDQSEFFKIETLEIFPKQGNSSVGNFCMPIEAYLKEYLLAQSLDEKKYESAKLSSGVKELKSEGIKTRVNRLLASSKFIEQKFQDRDFENKQVKAQENETKNLDEYLEAQIANLKNIQGNFEDKVKKSRKNLETKKSHRNYYLERIKSYMNDCVTANFFDSEGRKTVKLTGIDGEDVNSFMKKYCEIDLMFQWIQQEENNLFYGTDGISSHIIQLSKTLRDEYAIKEISLNSILNIDIRIPDESEIQKILGEDCREIPVLENYKESNIVFSLFSSLRRYLYAVILTPLILLGMFGLGNKNEIFNEIRTAVGESWIVKLLGIGLIVFCFYALIRKNLKDRQDQRNSAADKIRKKFIDHYDNYVKDFLINPAQEEVDKELRRIFQEYKAGLENIRADYCSRCQTEDSKQTENDSFDVSSILKSLEKIRAAAEN